MKPFKTLLLAASISATSSAMATTQLNVIMNVDSNQDSFYKGLVTQFEKENPDINVNIDFYPTLTYKTAFKVRATANNAPDVIANWAGSRTNQLVDDGLVYDLDKLELNNIDRLPETLLAQFRHEGIQAGVPTRMYAITFLKNDNIFSELNLSEPETFDDLASICKTIRDERPELTPIAFGASEPWAINHYISQLFFRAVPDDVLQADIALTNNYEQLYTHTGYVQALDNLLLLNDASCFNAGVNSLTPESAAAMFGAEMSAMLYSGDWNVSGTLEAGLTNFSGMLMPELKGGEAGFAQSVLAGSDGWLVHSKSENKDAAARFVDFFISDEIQAEMTYGTKNPSPNLHGVDLDRLPAQQVWMIQKAGEGEGAGSPLDTLMSPRMDRLVLSLGQELINGTVSSEQFMEKVRAEARDQMDRS